ncbi:MAG: hypothetical protein KDB31_14380 [Microthrixaceae bacterium]|nr:hypothetical protein [Microthrixaceae bacterium]
MAAIQHVWRLAAWIGLVGMVSVSAACGSSDETSSSADATSDYSGDLCPLTAEQVGEVLPAIEMSAESEETDFGISCSYQGNDKFVLIKIYSKDSQLGDQECEGAKADGEVVGQVGGEDAWLYYPRGSTVTATTVDGVCVSVYYMPPPGTSAQGSELLVLMAFYEAQHS